MIIGKHTDPPDWERWKTHLVGCTECSDHYTCEQGVTILGSAKTDDAPWLTGSETEDEAMLDYIESHPVPTCAHPRAVGKPVFTRDGLGSEYSCPDCGKSWGTLDRR